MNVNPTCPDCGADIGEPHVWNCDVARCPFCGQQRITCGCSRTGESLWTGEWPTTAQQPQPSHEARKERVDSLSEPAFTIFEPVSATAPSAPEETIEKPPTPKRADWVIEKSGRWVWHNGLAQPVVENGHRTGKYRVCRTPHGWSGQDCSRRRDVPWEAVVDGFDGAKQWLAEHGRTEA